MSEIKIAKTPIHVRVFEGDTAADYKSVLLAFKFIGLPLAKHVALRTKVRTDKTATIEHEGKTYVFERVE